MVRLNRLQTRALTRLFKKIDVEDISFDQSTGDSVIFWVMDQAGWEAMIEVNDLGQATSFSKGFGRTEIGSEISEGTNEGQ